MTTRIRRRRFACLLIVGATVTIASVALSSHAKDQPATGAVHTQGGVQLLPPVIQNVPPTTRPAADEAVPPTLPPGSVRREFNGYVYYLVPL